MWLTAELWSYLLYVAANTQVIGMPEVEDIHVARVHHCPLVLLYLDLEAELWLTKGLLVADTQHAPKAA
jgi:hypothetical protein